MNKEEILRLLSEQQEQIITASEPKILISAGPGSGKTRTISGKIARILASLTEEEGVIAISFTREAASELRGRIAREADLKRSFIGTFDSLILEEIVDPFKNRFLSAKNMPMVDEKLKFRLPIRNSEIDVLTKSGPSILNKKSLQHCYQEWIQNLLYIPANEG
jgi:superfamily I DNA/RNA helicase